MFRLGSDSALFRNAFVIRPELRAYLEREAHPAGLRRLQLVRWILRLKDRRHNDELLYDALPGPGDSGDLMGWALRKSAEWYSSLLTSDTVVAPFGDAPDTDVAATPDAPSARYKLAVMARVLRSFRQAADSAGIPIAVLVIPGPFHSCVGYAIHVDSSRFPRYDRRRTSSAVEAMARASGLPVLNLWIPFGAPHACALYYGNTHWNAQGQALAARVLSDSLKRWGLWR
jgi:hypothetical protein